MDEVAERTEQYGLVHLSNIMKIIRALRHNNIIVYVGNVNIYKIQGRGPLFPLFCHVQAYVAIMAGCSHCKHNYMYIHSSFVVMFTMYAVTLIIN